MLSTSPALRRALAARARASSSSSAALLARAPAAHPAFTLLRREAVAEHACVASLYRHDATRAELLSVVCDSATDSEKVFGAALRTPPRDSSGVAHVLEHSVLCGSRRYPSKEPFVELLKSSLQTFLNAMTYPDRTVYPVASPNEADFRNLVRVYLDAVFHPAIDLWTMLQEGWHLEAAAEPTAGAAAGTGAMLSYKGVVYNEMKGVFSNPDSIHAMSCESALFSPEHTYARSSGGDPLEIPRLTFEQFRAFHATHYHPSNARLWFFGDDCERTRLEMVADSLEGFSHDPRAQHASVVPLQPPIAAVRRLSEPYPVAAGGDEATQDVDEDGNADSSGLARPTALASAALAVSEATFVPVVQLCAAQQLQPSTPAGTADEHYVTVSWLLHLERLGPQGNGSLGDRLGSSAAQGRVTIETDAHGQSRVEVDDVTHLGLAVLTHLLMGTQAATLYKALTDSALGSSVMGGGLDDSLLQPTFSAGLKGVRAEHVALVEPLVMHALTMAAGAGFSVDHVTASLNSIEFALREFATGGSPKGLSLFLGVVQSWIYGRDPFRDLRYEAALAGLKARCAEDADYFQDLVRRLLLSNSHRAVVHSFPDPHFGARREAVEASRLAATAAGMRAGELDEVRAAAARLLTRQATPDSPEALASIPSLQVRDLPVAETRIASTIAALPRRETAPSARMTAPMLLRHEQNTSGIGYGRVAVDLSALPQRLLPLLPLFAWCVTSTGTAARDEVALSRALGTHTGGVGAGVNASDVPGRPDLVVPLFTLSGKCLTHSSAEMGALMLEALSTCRLDRPDRIAHFLRDTVASHEAGLASSGHRYAGGVLSAARGKGGWLRELWGGVTSLQGARMLLTLALPANDDAARRRFAALEADLEEVRAHVLTAASRGNVLVSSTGDAAALPPLEAALADVVAGMAAASSSESAPSAGGHSFARAWSSEASNLVVAGLCLPLTPLAALAAASCEGPAIVDDGRPIGIIVPTQVNYCVRAAELRDLSAASAPTGVPGAFSAAAAASATGVQARFASSGGAEVVANALRTSFLWEKVRVQGGAYGGFCSLSASSGALSFSSYRDPHLDATLRTFDGAAAFLAEHASAPALGEDLRKAVISSIGAIDAPLSPSERGATSTGRFISGVTDEMLQRRRDEILGAGPADAAAFGERVAAAWGSGGARTAVVGAESAFAASAERGWRLFAPLSPKAAK